MKPSEALSEIVAALLADATVYATLGDRIYIDFPGEAAPTSPDYDPVNEQPFAYFGGLSFDAATCDSMECRVAIFVESFAADRGEALDCAFDIAAALAAFKLSNDQPVSVLSGGDEVTPHASFSAQCSITFHL